MEEEVCYSSVLFTKSEGAKPREERSALQTVYGEVKYTQGQQEELSPSQTTDDQYLPVPQRNRCAVVVLSLLTALLLSALVTVIVYYQLTLSESNKLLVRYENAITANQHLQEENKRLMMEWNNLNQTLEVIYQFSDFPVDQYCPVTDNVTQERKCSEHCEKGWLYFKSSCYQFIYNVWPDWNSWEKSQSDCVEKKAHLVIIDTAEEQAFVSNHTKSFYDGYGYWIGLSKIQGKWQWVNGSELTGGYWMTGSTGISACVLSIPETDPLNWRDASCSARNRWICEKEATVWPTAFKEDAT